MPAPDSRLTQQQLEERQMRRDALATALVAARKRAGLTQTELAQRAGMSRSAIARFEAGRASLANDFIWSICKALDMKPSELWAQAEADQRATQTLES